MQFIKKIIIALTLLISLITFAQSETTWITKKKDKSKKVEKVEKNETVSSWIKKKEKNKEKFEEKKEESKAWISKKSKSGICHKKGTQYYKQTKNYKSFNSINDCLNDGGRLPR